MSFEWKKVFVFFAVSHFNNFFVTHDHIPSIFNLLDQNYQTAKTPIIPNYIQTFKIWKPNRKLILYYGKVKETFFTLGKKVKLLLFLGTREAFW